MPLAPGNCGADPMQISTVGSLPPSSIDRYLAARVQGYGTLLMEEAERIARVEHRSTKLAVISGVGTRHYYRRLGYQLEGPYMVKALMPLRR